MRLAIAIAILVGCEPSVATPPPQVPVREVEPPPAAAQPEPEPARITPRCAQARECCHVFASALPAENIDEARLCAGVDEAEHVADPTRRCRMMIDGWRQALERMPNIEIPDACRSQER